MSTATNTKHRSHLDMRSVGYLGSDIAIRKNQDALRGFGWTIKNNFPFWVEIIAHVHHLSPRTTLTSISPGGSVFIDEKRLSNVSLIRVVLLRMISTADPYDLVDAFSPRMDSRKIIIGDIGYTSNTGMREVYSNSQIRGIRIHNHISLPISIYFKGINLAKIEGNNGLSYHAGGKSVVFVDNDRNGFMIGDVLSIKVLVTTPEIRSGKVGSELPYLDVAFTDQAFSDLHVGLITQNSTQGPNDLYAYSLKYPSMTGAWTQNFLVE